MRAIASKWAGTLPTVLAEYPDGRRFLIPGGDIAYAAVFFDGEHEPGASRAVCRFLRPGEFAIDVGASIGWFTLLMKACVGPAGEVWAVEPLPEARKQLAINLSLNPDLPAIIKELALGSSCREVELHTFASLPQGHASLSKLGRTDFTTHRAAMQRLDDVLDDACGHLPALVKVDVEGAEFEVLEGAKRLLASAERPAWLFEINYENASAFGYRPRDLLKVLEHHAPHHVYRVAHGNLETEEDPERAPNGGMWLCVPPARLERVGHRNWR